METTQSRAEFSTFERWLITLFSGVFWGAVAVVVTVGLDAFGYLPTDNVQAFGFTLVGIFAVVGATLAYRFPRVFEVFLWFMP
ncbi:MAG: hypothetical protein AAGE01_00520 [Pseudomonadota bacterium]